MGTAWLGNVEASTFWAHRTWSELASFQERDRCLVILPIYGLGEHGLGFSLDMEEVVGSEILRRSVQALPPSIAVQVLPALRFGLAPYPSTVFGVDPETGHELIREISDGVRAAGFKKLVFFSTSPWHEEWIDASSRDVRAELGLQTFVVHLSGLDLDFHPGSSSRQRLQAVAAAVFGESPRLSRRPGVVLHPGFRPGNWAWPSACAFDATLRGAEILSEACQRLSRLLLEIDVHPPLGNPSQTTIVARPSVSTLPEAAPSKGSFWPAHRDAYLTHLTMDELQALPAKEEVLIVLPTGSIEQHGYHLPVGVDAVLGQAWISEALARIRGRARVWVAPPLTYGKSNEHVGFPGTVSISARTLRRLLLAQARQLKALGFRKLAIFNTHGGNSAVIVYTLREIQTELGLAAGMVGLGYTPDTTRQEQDYGFHAGEWETSLMLAVSADWVHMDKATCEFPPGLEKPGELRPENAAATYSWITKDISVSGTLGNAQAATPEKGRRWLAEGSESLANRIIALSESLA